MRLAPQFSIRWALGVMAAAGVLFLIAAQAVRGAKWPLGFFVALTVFLLALAVYALMFLVTTGTTNLAARIFGDRHPAQARPQSPFATQPTAEEAVRLPGTNPPPGTT